MENGGNSINFLDLTIKLDPSTYKLDFSIYRKPSATDTCIPFDSTHPQNHKMASFRAFLNRLLDVPMSMDNTKHELDTILQIAENNGYNAKTILSLFSKVAKKHITRKYLYRSSPPSSPKSFRSILFTGKASYKVAQVIEKHEDVKVAFYNPNKLKNLIFNCKDRIPKLMNSGIYNISVPYHGEYIGKTSRSVITRIKERFSSVRNKHPDKSGFASYMLSNNLPISSCTTKVLQSNIKNPKKLDLYETYYIRNAVNNNITLFNSQLERKEHFELIM